MTRLKTHLSTTKGRFVYVNYVLPVGYSYVFVFISLFPHMFPVCSRLVWKCESQNEFPHWHQFRIRASLRILNSLELRSSWSTKCTLGTGGFSRVRLEFSVLAEGRHIFGCRPKPQAANEVSNFAEKYRSSRVHAPIRHQVLRGIKCP